MSFNNSGSIASISSGNNPESIASISSENSIADKEKKIKEIKEIDNRIKKIAIANFLLLGVCIVAFNIFARPVLIVLGIAQWYLWIAHIALNTMRNEKQSALEGKSAPTSTEINTA